MFLYAIINYWFKILEFENSKYIKYAYQLMLHDVEINQNTTNWVSKLKDLLSTLGFYEAWLNHGVGNKNVFYRK